MRTIHLDKIASVTSNCQLSREVRVADEIPAVEGGVIVVRILNSKSVYNQLELPSGRFSTVNAGDAIAGALGHRNALFGYSGRLPESVRRGDRLHMLNLGGVLGMCDSVNPDLGEPFACEVLGQVLHFPHLAERIGVPAHIGQGAASLDGHLDGATAPVIAIVGTCMNAGKTAASCGLVQEFTRRGLRVAAGKVTGVSLRRDIWAMEDAGACATRIFTDFGIVTTTPENAAQVARSMIVRLEESRPDLIVLEMGDGLLGPYGVDAVLSDRRVRSCFRAIVLAASDPVAAWGGVRILRERHELAAAVVTGPATDNAAGVVLVEGQTGVRARNARSDLHALTEIVLGQVSPSPSIPGSGR